MSSQAPSLSASDFPERYADAKEVFHLRYSFSSTVTPVDQRESFGSTVDPDAFNDDFARLLPPSCSSSPLSTVDTRDYISLKLEARCGGAPSPWQGAASEPPAATSALGGNLPSGNADSKAEWTRRKNEKRKARAQRLNLLNGFQTQTADVEHGLDICSSDCVTCRSLR